MTTLILYLSDQLTACPSLWKRPSHPQGHTYCPPVLPGHCPRNMSLSVCTWKSKAQVMSPLLSRALYTWKPWPFTFHLSALRLVQVQRLQLKTFPRCKYSYYFTEAIKKRQLISERSRCSFYDIRYWWIKRMLISPEQTIGSFCLSWYHVPVK